ncbi:MAG: hypothetical protein EBU97_04575 [Rhodobacteraceae bacterium]|nr:hypothetical protein [Paracoccaceae bacterium]
MKTVLMVLAALAFAPPAWAGPEKIVSGLSQNRVSITADFDGSEILIYGAVKRDAPAPDSGPMEVLITVEGPSQPVVIRRKEHRFGIWINTDQVPIKSAPSFYAVATTAPLHSILSEVEDLRHQITLPRVIDAIGLTSIVNDPQDFVTALMRLRSANGSYRVQEGNVTFIDQTLFRADIVLPANLTEGNYKARIFLTRGGEVVDDQERTIRVRKEGIERFLYNLARDQPFIYGLASLIMAVLAGWGASAGFALLRR